MSEGLPKGWVEAKLGDISTHPQYGWTCSSTKEGELKLLRTTDISNGKVNWDVVPYCSKNPDHIEKYILKQNDILVSRAGSVGVSYCVSENDLKHKAVFASYLIRFCPFIPASFVYYFFKSHKYWHFISGSQLGIAVPNVNATKLAELPIPLPPLNEQKRIVAKLDTIMPRIDAVKERLEKVPGILKRFRQSVLTAAVTGKLTEQWREEHPEVGKWEEKTLSSIIPKGNIFDGPFGSNLKTNDYVNSGIRVIRLENIDYMSFIGSKETYITNKKYQTLLKHTVYKGDIIFSSFITENIRACILPNLITRAIVKADCFCIRPDIKTIDTKFLLLALVSFNSYDQLVVHIHGATRPRINTTQLKKLILSLPPLEEQKEIVRQVDKLFALADKVEAHYYKAKARVDKLSQSVLAKAFRGELVPQDPNDEPSEKLLGRILEEKAKMEAELKCSRKRGRKKEKDQST